MKKFKYILIAVLIIIVIKNLAVEIITENDVLATKTAVWAYEQNKKDENLATLCVTLSYRTTYDSKIIYFGDYLNSGCAEKIAVESYPNSEFHQKYYVSGYESEYCLALLHTNRVDDFKDYYSKNVETFMEQNVFYYTLFYEIKNHDWTNEQLLVLLDVLRTDTAKDYFTEDLIFQKDCIEAECHRLLENSEQKEEANERMLSFIQKTV